MKVNHGSGQNIFRRDSTRPLNAESIRTQLGAWMKRGEYWTSREWAYKDIQPRIICGMIPMNTASTTNGTMTTSSRIVMSG